ncbi:MAG: exodeoxyribonuclease VII small subunit [Longimicrobiales bacterium]
MTPPLTLEERIARLEAIVVGLEGDGLELEEALALFAEGVDHLRATDRLLRESELKIERLLEDPDGRVIAQPLADPDV